MEPRISIITLGVSDLKRSVDFYRDALLPAERSRFGGFTLAHNVSDKAEADSVIAEALAAGATLLKPAADTFWGGYFADPDGHPWEAAWNPYFPLE